MIKKMMIKEDEEVNSEIKAIKMKMKYQLVNVLYKLRD